LVAESLAAGPIDNTAGPRGGVRVPRPRVPSRPPDGSAPVASGPGWTVRAGRTLRAAWPALALYLGLRLVGLLVLWMSADGERGLTAMLGAYDAAYYAGIAARGYDDAIPIGLDGRLDPTNLAFFPLYPALVALLEPLLPGGVATAGILVSWLAGLAAAWGLYTVGTQLRDRRTGVVLAGLWAVVPHGIVQSMGYTETLFTALAAWSLAAVLRRDWLTAGILCLLAGLTRPTAVALIAAVGLAAVVALVRRRDGWRPWVAAALAPAGLLAFVGWVGHRLGRLDGYLHVQSDAWLMWYDGGRYTFSTLGKVLAEPNPLAMYVTTAVLLLVAALLVLLVVDRPPWPLLVYAAVMFVLVVGGAGYYHAKARLLIPAFPLLLPIAYALAAARRSTAVVVLAVLAALSAWYGAYLCLGWGFSP
jgi:Dolichyl-phosphate-mannose-protein mannosyltransferase